METMSEVLGALENRELIRALLVSESREPSPVYTHASVSEGWFYPCRTLEVEKK